MMTARERIKAAMQRRQPDRVPVWCQLSVEHTLRYGNLAGEYPQSIEDWVRAECGLGKRYGFDAAQVFLPAVREGTRVEEGFRLFVNAVPKGDPAHDFSTADPDSWSRDLPPRDPADFYSSHLAREVVGPDYHLGGWTGDAFSCAVQWFPTMEQALMAMIDDPPRFAALIEYFEPQCLAYARDQVRLGGLESICVSSPYAGSSFISRDIYRDLVLPQLTRLAEALQPEPAFSYLHTCGFLGDRLELVTSSGIDGLECMDPPPLGDVELGDAKTRVGDRVFLKGNLDAVNVLWRGTDEEVQRAVLNCLRVGMPGGGYILSTACSVPPGVPPERLGLLAPLAEQFGRYEE